MINVEGIVLPNKPLTNFQLIDAGKKLKIKNFRGVFVRDELPKKPRKKECGIVNTGDSSTDGFYWVCWYKNFLLWTLVSLSFKKIAGRG